MFTYTFTYTECYTGTKHTITNPLPIPFERVRAEMTDFINQIDEINGTIETIEIKKVN